MRLRRLSGWTVLVLLGTLVLGGGAAKGTHPGTNGVIAFEKAVPSVGQSIFTVNADGTGLTDVLRGDFGAREFFSFGDNDHLNPSWSPDGSRIAFDAIAGADNPLSTFCPQSDAALFALTPATDTIDVLSCQPGLFDRLPDRTSWSPDGLTIVRDIDDSNRDHRLGLVDVASGTETVLFGGPDPCLSDENAKFPSWSPLGDKIVFARSFSDICPSYTEHAGIWTIDPDGTGLTELTDDGPFTPPIQPDWSPDGSTIVYLRAGNPASSVGSEMYLVDASGGTPTLLLDGALFNNPMWSPDGTKIAFASNGDGDFDIYVMDADGSNIQQVTSLPGNELNPSWQRITAPPDPDGDDDGVDDSIDTGAGSFDDGSGTSGSIVDTAGLDVLVSDADDSGDGVKITVGPGIGKATFTICGFTVKVSAGSEVVVSCASVILEVVEGSAEVVLGGGTVVITVPEGGAVEVSDEGGTFFSVENLGQTNVTVAVDGTESTLTAGATTSVSTDVTDPTVTCNPASFLLNEPGAMVTATVSDGGSGPAATSVSAPASTAAPGSHSVQITGTDDAGNETTVPCGYTVSYVFQGFLQPVDNPPTVNSAKAGQRIPVGWRVSDFYGLGVSDPASFSNVTSGSLACDSSDPQDAIETYTGNSGLQYQGNGTWQFNWQTPKSYAGQCRVLRLNLADGAGNRLAEFRFK